MALFTDLLVVPAGLDAGIPGDNAQTGARGIQEHSVEVLHQARKLSAVVVAHDAVLHSHSLKVELQGSQTLFLQVIGQEDSLVLHHLGDVSGLASGGSGHIHDFFSRLGIEGHDRHEGGRTLEHVVAGQILRSGSQGHLALIDLETNLGPVGERVKVDSSLDESLGEFLPLALETVDSESGGSLGLVGV